VQAVRLSKRAIFHRTSESFTPQATSLNSGLPLGFAAAEIKIRRGLKNAKNAAATEKARKRC
jgi:hypothetical protein